MYKIIKVKDYRQIKAKIMQLKALDEGKDLYGYSFYEKTVKKFDLRKEVLSTRDYNSGDFVLVKRGEKYPKEVSYREDELKYFGGVRYEDTSEYTEEYLKNNRQNKRLMDIVKNKPELFNKNFEVVSVEHPYIVYETEKVKDGDVLITSDRPIYKDREVYSTKLNKG